MKIVPLELMQEAKQGMDRAYVPYSRFRVGAALVDSQGKVHLGCNIENAAYGATNCAERTALFHAIAEGQTPRSFAAIAVIGDTHVPIAPCGICRQVLLELCGPDMPVYLGNLRGQMVHTTVGELLPGAFDSNSLSNS